MAARDFVRQKIGKKVMLFNVKKGKYAGRVVARVQLTDGNDLTTLLVEAGHARPYDGGKRKGWCFN